MAELVAKVINYIGALGPYTQVGAGSASGWIIGLSIMKIGKFTAAVIGSAIILIKIAEIEDLIHSDWPQMQQNAHNISLKTFSNVSVPGTEAIPAKIQNFLVSFIGGSLIGIGCA